MKLTQEKKEKYEQIHYLFNEQIGNKFQEVLKQIPIEVSQENFDKIRGLHKIANELTYQFNLDNDISTELIGRNLIAIIDLRIKRKMGECLLADERFSINKKHIQPKS